MSEYEERCRGSSSINRSKLHRSHRCISYSIRFNSLSQNRTFASILKAMGASVYANFRCWHLEFFDRLPSKRPLEVLLIGVRIRLVISQIIAQRLAVILSTKCDFSDAVGLVALSDHGKNEQIAPFP